MVDAFDLPLPDSLPPGQYRLITGLYNFETGQRLGVTIVDDVQTMDDAVILREVSLGDGG